MSLKALLEKLGPAPAGPVDAPELGQGIKVHVRRFNLADRQELSDASKRKTTDAGDPESLTDRYRRLIPMCACDEMGQPVFEPNDPAVDQLPGKLADRILDAALKFNTMEESEAKKSSPTPK